MAEKQPKKQPAKKAAMPKPKAKKKLEKKVAPAPNLTDQLNKALGYTAIRTASHPAVNLPRLHTGSVRFTRFLGGGYKFGRMIERYGNEGSGKSTMCYMGMAQAIELIKLAEAGKLQVDDSIGMSKWFINKLPGMKVAFVDVEKSWDPLYASQCGVDLDYCEHADPQIGDHVFDVLEAMLSTKQYLYLGIDSIAAIVPDREAEKRAQDKTMGELAQLMSRGLRKVNRVNEITILDWLNQQREKIGVMFGSPITTTGGKAMAFYASYRFQMSRGMKITEDVVVGHKADGKPIVEKHPTGHEIKILCAKDKVGKLVGGKLFNVRDRACVLSYLYGEGISMSQECKQLAFELGFIEGVGSATIKLPAVGGFPAYEFSQRGKYWLDDAFMDEGLQQHVIELSENEVEFRAEIGEDPDDGLGTADLE